MFAIDHLGTLGMLLLRFQEFLRDAPPEHVAMLEKILDEYANQVLHDNRVSADFPAMVIEVASLWAEVGEHGTMKEPSEYKDLFGDRGHPNHRRDLALCAAIYARLLDDEEVAAACERLRSFNKAPVLELVKPGA